MTDILEYVAMFTLLGWWFERLYYHLDNVVNGAPNSLISHVVGLVTSGLATFLLYNSFR